MDGKIMVYRITILITAIVAMLVIPSFGQTSKCITDFAKDGDVVMIYAELYNAASPLFIRPKACPENAVILAIGDSPKLGNAKLPVNRDKLFLEFERLSREEQPDTGNVTCLHCPKYKITANFEGKLEIAPYAGGKRNPKTGKIVGREGFGSVAFISRYRLILTGISNLEAVERKPMPVLQDGGKNEPKIIPDIKQKQIKTDRENRSGGSGKDRGHPLFETK
jgi:hypothetical protein